MKTIILKDKLKEGISVVERVAGRSLTLPILDTVLIKTEKNFINLTTTDLEIGINWWSLVKTEKEGKIAVPAKILSSFINLLPNKPIQFGVKDLNLEIESDNYKTLIKGVDPEEFPIIPKISTEEKIVVGNQLFCQSLSKVVDIASLSSTKVEISGVYFLFQGNQVTMTATDSFRLGEKKLFLPDSASKITKDYSFILPQRAAKEVINIFGDKEGSMSIYFSPNQVLFESLLSETNHPQIQLTSRLIEGDYPNYTEIIPKTYETKIALAADEFANQIKMASLFSGKINEVKLKADPEKGLLNIFSQNPDVGEYNSSVAAKIEGKPCETSFNYRFLLDGLLNMISGDKKKEVVFGLNGSEKAGVLKSKNEDSYLYLVMPIKAG
ncbi:MAG: DNA polymerase III subunit beta [Candidatus Pacebacteria bacterium]|nr:DNA polymerase III subunit beta [Candidatus Paceibacterota bacterium]